MDWTSLSDNIEKFQLVRPDLKQDYIPFDGALETLSFDNRVYNPYRVLRFLSEKYPANNYSTFESYLFVNCALSRFYYQQACEQASKYSDSKKAEIEKFYNDTEANFQTWICNINHQFGDSCLSHLSLDLPVLLSGQNVAHQHSAAENPDKEEELCTERSDDSSSS